MQRLLIAKLVLPLFLIAMPGAAAGDPGDSDETEAVGDPARSDSQKIIIGEVEEVVLLPWGITLPARIDTGATMSALDARNVTVRNNFAEFKLSEEYRGLRLRVPIVGWTQVRNAVGSQRRPVVEIGVCLGPKLIRTLATLSDRSQMTYPFLVGRNVLNGSFTVDTSLSRAARPACSTTSS